MTVQSEYGRALFLLAKEEDAIEQILGDITVCARIFSQNPGYTSLLDTPAIAKDEKLKLADEAFGTLTPYVKNLIKILTERHAVHSFGEIYETYLDMYNDYMGIVEVEAVSAIALSEAQTCALKEKLVAETGKKIIIKNTVDPSILGGLKLRYSGKQVDGSVRTRLDALSESIKNIVI